MSQGKVRAGGDLLPSLPPPPLYKHPNLHLRNSVDAGGQEGGRAQ